MKFGYARVLPNDQDLDIQIQALEEYGIDELYIERITETCTDRPKLRQIRKRLKKGDTIAIYSLDKLGVNINQLIYLTEGLHKKGIRLVSLKEKINPSTNKGKYAFQLVDDLVQMQGNIVSEQTKEGLNTANAKGKYGGRPPVQEDKVNKIIDMYFSDHLPVKEIIETTGLAKTTIYKYLNIEKKKRGNK